MLNNARTTLLPPVLLPLTFPSQPFDSAIKPPYSSLPPLIFHLSLPPCPPDTALPTSFCCPAAPLSSNHVIEHVLSFVGPPGMGKTLLNQLIAQAIGQPFQLIALGGVHDEAEIQGHHWTYIASRPGLLVQALRKACTDPVLLL
jgi:hypothetical protein